MHYLTYFILLLLITSCSSTEESSDEKMRRLNQKGEFIYRNHDEFLFTAVSPERKTIEQYPWEIGNTGKHPKITKEFFRCKGSILNPPRTDSSKEKEIVRYYDCGGAQKHSLPLQNGKEYIYPILIDLLNHIQIKTGKKVVITCGHRCPDHNTYSDPSKDNQYSKHMIGAEVAFYVQGMENNPDAVVKLLLDYYKDSPKYKGQKEFQEFSRYDKETNVKIKPWYNKEVFIKIFGKKEGRNFDNRHPYPYLSLQVRYDNLTKEKVTYSWDKAFKNFHRW